MMLQHPLVVGRCPCIVGGRSRVAGESASSPSNMLKPGSRVMAEKKAVLFNFWGVVVPSKPDGVFQKVEERHSLPGGFLSSIYSQTDGSLRRAERGDMPLSEMLPALEAECVKESQAKGAALPSDWSINGVLKEIRKEMMNVRHAVLKTAASLRRSGVLTAVLANHWLDDALWVDAGEAGVKAAEAAGMKAVLMESLDAALEKISEFTGVKAEEAESPPPFCGPDEVCHGYVTIRVMTGITVGSSLNRDEAAESFFLVLQTGVRTHFVEMGCGPPVLLCHGFPESWYSWRFQIPALAAAGFRVLALDMKGYGESTAPPVLVPSQAIPQVTLVGHDWGGALVWSMAQFHPERVRAVASLNTPLFKVDPSVPSSEKLKDIPIFDYQLYFQTPGVAEAELEKNLERTFKIFFSRSSERVTWSVWFLTGGLFVGLPEEIPQSSMLTQSVLQYYVSQFEKSGFRGPLNWYRNGHANWKWSCSQPTGKLLMPALMVTAGKDFVLLPALSKGMEDMIPNLTRGHIEECGHWTQMDKPAETNDILIGWLKEVHQKGCGGGS
ncbi:Bifunctional epoxide hydrolase 2 [Oryzias melastigma]|uniref:Bifunctional epoxide hydrolase 2 n=1 Tax=Oryzias melastigma TaxID=30732 RepID=A0A834KXP4_ORYME|nr:Bifunctional epoxide hydrolase 2 [Oryzias melastigma]